MGGRGEIASFKVKLFHEQHSKQENGENAGKVKELHVPFPRKMAPKVVHGQEVLTSLANGTGRKHLTNRRTFDKTKKAEVLVIVMLGRENRGKRRTSA